MKERIKRIIDDVVCESGKIFSVNSVSCDIDGERVHIVCDISAEAPLFDMEIDDIDYYVNVSFEGDYLMVIEGVVFDDGAKDPYISESCRDIYKFFKRNIIDEISAKFEEGRISADEYDILFDLCEDIKRNLWSIKELI